MDYKLVEELKVHSVKLLSLLECRLTINYGHSIKYPNRLPINEVFFFLSPSSFFSWRYFFSSLERAYSTSRDSKILSHSSLKMMQLYPLPLRNSLLVLCPRVNSARLTPQRYAKACYVSCHATNGPHIS